MSKNGAVFFLFLWPFCGFSGDLPLAWNQPGGWLGPDARARIRTADGARIGARIQSAREDQLVLAVLKSSDSRRYAPGEMVLDRTSIRQLEVRREKPESSGGRAGFATLFGIIGALAAKGAEGDALAAAHLGRRGLGRDRLCHWQESGYAALAPRRSERGGAAFAVL